MHVDWRFLCQSIAFRSRCQATQIFLKVDILLPNTPLTQRALRPCLRIRGVQTRSNACRTKGPTQASIQPNLVVDATTPDNCKLKILLALSRRARMKKTPKLPRISALGLANRLRDVGLGRGIVRLVGTVKLPTIANVEYVMQENAEFLMAP